MCALLIKRSAERDLRRLPRALFKRVKERILFLEDAPRPHGCAGCAEHAKGGASG